MVVFAGIQNAEIYGGIGLVIAIAAIIWLMRSKGGRLGEEIQEEKETRELEKDEVVVEVAQRDEKKECKMLKKIFEEIVVLAKNVDHDFYIREHQFSGLNVTPYHLKDNIDLALNRLMDEKMSVEVAMETFKLLHASINAFLTCLPRGYGEIDRLVMAINQHQNRYYKDLIKELQMNQVKKEILKKLWRNVLDEEKGRGVPKAA